MVSWLQPSSEIQKPLQPGNNKKSTHTGNASIPASYQSSIAKKSASKDDKEVKSQYSLQNVTTKLQTPLKANSSKPENNVIYQNQEPMHTGITSIPARNQSSTAKKSASKDDKEVKSQYSLQNVTTKLQTPPKDKSFKPENNVVYHNQWTECSAQILDEFNNPVHSTKMDVSSNCRHVDFRDVKIEKRRLHFKMKSCQTGNISIFIKINNFILTKDFYVTFNPCSSSLSDISIESVDAEKEEFVFRVFIFDVFGEPAPSNTTANVKLDTSCQSDENEVVSSEKHIEPTGQICFDITVKGNRPWSRYLVVLLNGGQVSHARGLDFTDEVCNAIDDLDDEEYRSIKPFFVQSECRMIIPLTTGEDDGKFIPYNENDCKLQSQHGSTTLQLVCKNVLKRDILGEDFAHINNIKRVLELKDRVEIQETKDCAILHLKNIKPDVHSTCKEVVQHLLRGLYYRRKASEAARIRMDWKNRLISIDEVLLLDKDKPSFIFCKYFRDFFGDLLNRYNHEACDELFNFFNFNRDASEVDLHGLLVADEKKLESLRLNLLIGFLNLNEINKILNAYNLTSEKGGERCTLRKKLRNGEVHRDQIKQILHPSRLTDSLEDLKPCNLKSSSSNESESFTDMNCSDTVDAIIKKCRLESDEAIRKLKEKLDKKNNTPWLEIIVGAGHHSKIKNEQKIRPKVEKFLQERNLEFASVNKGSLVVTFKPYRGPEPCFGEYYCEECNHCWKSSKSYVGKYQKCTHCKSNCWPVKQRQKEKIANYYRDGDGIMKGRSVGPHQSSLCQQCQELGHPCNEDDYYDSD